MILAGVDEAGYGPLLGPLVVGCCAISVPQAGREAEWPDLWRALRRIVGRNATKRKLHINDSKAVYSPAAGLKVLEQSMLAIASCRFGWIDQFDELLRAVSPATLADLNQHPWYACSNGSVRLPFAVESAAARIMANALKVELKAANCVVEHLAAEVVLEGRLNVMLDQTRNKSSTLFSLAARHLDALINRFGDRGLVIVCDRQGGREHYGGLLRLMFEDWHLEIETERDDLSDYRLHRGENCVRIVFATKSESQCMPTAIASMLSKYLRECMMRRFNAFWQTHLPQVTPTAGYYNDGLRFLQDIDAKRRELGIDESRLVRSR